MLLLLPGPPWEPWAGHTSPPGSVFPSALWGLVGLLETVIARLGLRGPQPALKFKRRESRVGKDRSHRGTTLPHPDPCEHPLNPYLGSAHHGLCPSQKGPPASLSSSNNQIPLCSAGWRAWPLHLQGAQGLLGTSPPGQQPISVLGRAHYGRPCRSGYLGSCPHTRPRPHPTLLTT